MCVYYLHAGTHKDLKRYQMPWNYVTGSCELPFGWLELNLGPLLEQQVFFIRVLSLAPLPLPLGIKFKWQTLIIFRMS